MFSLFTLCREIPRRFLKALMILLPSLYEGRPPKTPKLSSGGWAPCSTGFPLGEYSSTHLDQCTSRHCCEKLHSASVRVFLKTLSMHLLISWWVIYEHTRPHHECSAVSDQKLHDPPPHPPYSPDFNPSNVFVCFPGWKKSSKGNILLMGMWKKRNNKEPKH